MRPIMLTLILLFLPLTAMGQTADRAREEAARRAQQQMWNLEQLGLTDAQRAKILEKLTQAELTLESQRRKAIDEVLTPEQRKRYAGLEKWQTLKQGNALRAMRKMGVNPDQLGRQLGLTPEKQGKLRELFSGWARSVEGKLEKNSSKQELSAFVVKHLPAIHTKIEKMLGQDQMPAFRAYTDRVLARLAKFAGNKRRGPGGTEKNKDKGKGARRPGTRKAPVRRGPQQTMDRQIDRVLAALKASPEEAAAIRPVVSKLITHRANGNRALSTSREAIRRLAAESPDDLETLQKKAAALAAERTVFDTKQRANESALRELLTRAQEFTLVGMGVLPPREEK